MTALELRAWRQARHLSRRALAALLGVSWRTVERWEQGRSPVIATAALLLRELEREA